MLASVCGSDVTWENWDPFSPGSEESVVSSRLAETIQEILPLSQAAHSIRAILLLSLSKHLENLGKQDQLSFRKHFMQGSISSLDR